MWKKWKGVDGRPSGRTWMERDVWVNGPEDPVRTWSRRHPVPRVPTAHPGVEGEGVSTTTPEGVPTGPGTVSFDTQVVRVTSILTSRTPHPGPPQHLVPNTSEDPRRLQTAPTLRTRTRRPSRPSLPLRSLLTPLPPSQFRGRIEGRTRRRGRSGEEEGRRTWGSVRTGG